MKSCLRFEFENADVAGRFIDGILEIPNMKGVTITIPGIPEEKYMSEIKGSIKPESCKHYSECPTHNTCVIPCIPKCYEDSKKVDINKYDSAKRQKLKQAISTVKLAAIEFGYSGDLSNKIDELLKDLEEKVID